MIIETAAIFFLISPSNRSCYDKNQIEKNIKWVCITLDNKLLHRLLRESSFAHWNNAEIGPLLRYRRNPVVFERGLCLALCYFYGLVCELF